MSAKAAEKAMNANRTAKEKEIKELHDGFKGDEMVVVAHYAGLTVKQLTDLRGRIRKEGGRFRVAKNTLFRRALKGTKFEGLDSLFEGPVGVVASKDPMAAARIAYSFAKDNEKLVIRGGANANEVLSLETLKYLATLPSLDVLRGKIVGLLQAPGAGLARVINAHATKGEG